MKTNPLILLTTAIATLAPSLSAQTPGPSLAELEKPVEAPSLDPAKLAAFKTPLKARIEPVLISKAVGPMSFTSSVPSDLNFLTQHGGFEPMVWRPMLRPDKDSAPGSNIIHLGKKLDIYAAPGQFDGARVRVYQAHDGKLVLIRDARVVKGGHRGGDWKGVPYGALHCKPEETSFDVVFDNKARLNVPYWMKVSAIYEDRKSIDSAVVKVVPTTAATGVKKPEPYQRETNNKLKPMKAGLPTHEAPRNLKAEFQNGVARLTWEAPAPEGLLGYLIQYSETDPEKFEDSALEIDGRAPRPDCEVRKNDIVFVDQTAHTLDKSHAVGPFFWNDRGFWPEGGLKGLMYWPGENPDESWRLAEHSKSLPKDMVGAGKTCLELTAKTNRPTGVELLKVGGSKQAFYRVLAAKPHTFEAWVRGEGSLKLQFAGPYATDREEFPFPTFSKKPAGKFPMPAIPVPLDTEWKKVSVEFTPPGVPEDGMGAVYLTYTGPGTVFIDNVAIYENDRGKGDLPATAIQDLEKSKMTFMRTHELIKTKFGYTLDGMTNPTGANNYFGTRFAVPTFHDLLRQMKLSKTISPWLQIEMCLDRDEWLGFAEWFCAPYDPSKGDTPEKKPWAYKRWSMGQEKPWIDEFPRFAFELSNETWNGLFAPYNFPGGLQDAVTGVTYQGGEEYGVMNEYVIQTLRESPYWTKEHEAKTTFVLCGWAASPYGVLAKRWSPSSDIITSAAYCANDGLGDPKVFSDFKLFYQLQWALSAVAPQTQGEVTNRHQLLREGLPVDWGMYEFGPGYFVMPGDPQAAKEVDQRLARNITAAVYVLDSVLLRAQNGFAEQAFFTFEHQVGPWGTHTLPLFGGHSYPKWKAMTLYNRFGAGRYLKCDLESAPTWDFPEYIAMDNMNRIKRAALPKAPLVSVYSALEGNRLSVFVLSRKLDNFPIAGDDGFTPASITLPFKNAKKATVYKLVGDPRVDDRHEEHVKIQSQDLGSFQGGVLQIDQKTGADQRGLPPASIFCYVFEGIDPIKVNEPPVALIGEAALFTTGEPVRLVNRSTDTEDGKPKCRWDIEGVGTFEDFSPEVVFPKSGTYNLRLTATDSAGLTSQDDYQIVSCLKDTAQRPWVVWGNGSNSTVDLQFTSDAARLKGSGRNIQAILFEPLHGNFEVNATLECPQIENGKDVASSGLMLSSKSPWQRTWTPQGIGALWVTADGAVLNNRRQEILPKGSITFPVKARITVANSKATFAVERNGTWEDVITQENTQGPYHPAMGLFTGNSAGSAEFRNLQIKKTKL